jgi:hypothetical protein
MRKKKKKNAAEKPKRNVIQMSQEENAAVSIQRIAKGRKARRDVLELKATMSKDKEHHTKLRRMTSSPAIFDIIQRPGDGCRVAGLHLYNEISIMGKIIQPIPQSLHLPGHEISNEGPILSILGGGGNLFQKVASLETLINCSDAVFLGGLIGFAWLAHTSPAFWSGPSSKKALSLANTAFGATSSVCSGFYNIGVELRRLARFAEKKKVTIIAPIDAIAGVKNLKSPIFDVRIFNPKLTTAESQAISSTSSDDVGVISDESSVLVSQWRYNADAGGSYGNNPGTQYFNSGSGLPVPKGCAESINSNSSSLINAPAISPKTASLAVSSTLARCDCSTR